MLIEKYKNRLIGIKRSGKFKNCPRDIWSIYIWNDLIQEGIRQNSDFKFWKSTINNRYRDYNFFSPNLAMCYDVINEWWRHNAEFRYWKGTLDNL